MSELSLRIVSATVLLPISITAIWIGGWYFTALVVIVTAVMCVEWVRICGSNSYLIFSIVTIFGGMAPVFAMMGLFIMAWAIIAIGASLVLVVSGLPHWRTRILAALGMPYIGMTGIAIVWLRTEPLVPLVIILWLIFVVIATDSAGFFVGRSVGGPKLIPRVSPKKTWSGLLGSVAAASVVGLITAQVTGQSAYLQITGLSVCLALVAQTGDLIESGLKRCFSTKDSGGLIPGHGGFLDRLDGFLLATPMVAALTWISGDNLLMWHLR